MRLNKTDRIGLGNASVLLAACLSVVFAETFLTIARTEAE